MNRRALLTYLAEQLETVEGLVGSEGNEETLRRFVRTLREYTWFCLKVEAEARAIELKGRVGRRSPHPAVRAFVIRRDRSKCAICDDWVLESDIHLDHDIPVTHGGTEDPENLRVTHSWCNLQKGAKLQ